jgi:hypothetical protein
VNEFSLVFSVVVTLCSFVQITSYLKCVVLSWTFSVSVETIPLLCLVSSYPLLYLGFSHNKFMST